MMAGFLCNYTNDPDLGVLNDLYLDAQGNIAFTDTDQEDTIQNCYASLWLIQNIDYGFNLSLGIPWNVYLSSDTPVGNQMKSSIITTLNAINGVASIGNIDFNLNATSRVLSIPITINLVGGTSTDINFIP